MAARRGRGEGSVFERSPGVWVGEVSLGVTNGKRRRKTVYGASKAEVRERMLAVQQQEPGTVPDLGRQTLADYLQRWLAACKQSWAENTYDFYALMVDGHIVPAIGSVPMSKLRGQHILELLAAGRKAGKSPRMQKGIRVTLRTALDHGGHWVRLTTGLSRKSLQVESPGASKVRFWDDVQARQFLAAAETHELEALWLLAISTGMRQGEMLGLQWSSIDWQRGEISVQHSLVETKGVIRRLKEPKTQAGARTVAVTLPVLVALRRHQARAMAAGHRSLPMVFANKHADVSNPAALTNYRMKNSVRRSLARLIKAAGVDRVTFHELRHTSATLLLKANVPAKVVQERLGHSNIAVTLNTYSHVLPGMQRAAAESMDAVLRGESTPPVGASANNDTDG